MSADYRAAAALALEHMAVASDTASQMSYGSEATACALLYVGDQIAQLVETHRTANTIAAHSNAHGLLDTADEHRHARIIGRAALGLTTDPGGVE